MPPLQFSVKICLTLQQVTGANLYFCVLAFWSGFNTFKYCAGLKIHHQYGLRLARSRFSTQRSYICSEGLMKKMTIGLET